MAGPIDPRLLRRARATRGYLVAGVAVGSATAILTLGQAWLLSRSVADIFATGQLGTLAWAVGGLAAVFAGKAVLGWANEWLAQRASAAVKSQLRRDLLAARVERPLEATASGGLVTLVTQGLDGLDGYFSKYLPQLLLAVTVPLVVGAAVLFADLTSAVILAVTLPLIPVFMALVGWTTEAVTKRRWAVQTRLANHFADLIAGLPTLQVFGRAKAQAEGLRRSEARHRSETMRTLRVSFLSALVLELLATLSVAVIAVTVGFRVVYGDLDLATALFVLILAPEAYLPVRQVGVHYHDAADGLAAVDSAFALIDAPAADGAGDPAAGPLPGQPRGEDTVRPQPRVRTEALLSVRDLTHTYPGSASPALATVSFDVHPGEVVAVAGPSGAGKTTLLNAVMGFLVPSGGGVVVRDRIAWVGQQPGLLSGTVADNVRLGFPHATDAAVADALRRAGAADLPLDQAVGDDAEGVSAGERRRIAVARALLRVTLGRARLLVLDEPTAGLDADTEAGLLRTLRSLGVATLVVSHRPAVLAEADRVVAMASPGAVQGARGGTPTLAGSAAHSPGRPAAPPLPEEAPAEEPSRTGHGGRPLLRRLLDETPGSRGRLVASVVLAFCASAASVALMGVAAWLLSRAAEQPPVLYLQAGAVGVRFFGISRGAFRYVERLVGHDVALKLQSALRLETYARLARTTLLGRRRGDLLARVIADTEAVQDLVVRVWIPFAAAVGVIGATAVGVAVFSPGSALVLALTCALAAGLVPWLARRASARADAETLPLRGQLADAARELSRTAPDLVAYGAAADRLAAFVAVDEQLRRAAARSAGVRGVGTAAQVLAAGTAVIGALVIAGQQVQAGTLPRVLLAVAVLVPLALHESLATLIASAQTRTRARAALRRVADVLEAEPVGAGDLADPGRPVAEPALEVDRLTAGWPGSEPVVTGLSFRVGAGEKVALVGPSGVGKTTVAATVLGLIPPREGTVRVQGRVGYLAQDAHIFTTTVAENVRIGNRDATDADIADALARAGLALDPGRVVGEGGEALSGGESRRVALARLFVGNYQVLLLDEPTEHLDTATATALVDDIWATSAERPVLVITHDPAVVARCDRIVTLG